MRAVALQRKHRVQDAIGHFAIEANLRRLAARLRVALDRQVALLLVAQAIVVDRVVHAVGGGVQASWLAGDRSSNTV